MPDFSQLIQWFDDSFLDALAMLISAVVALGIGIVLERLVKRIILRIFDLRVDIIRLTENRLKTLRSIVMYVYEVAAYFIIIVIALSKLNLDISSVLAVAGVGGIAIGFGAQSLVKDMLAGLLFFIEDQFEEGDRVTVAGVTGTVERMTLRMTLLRTESGESVTVPNGEIHVVTNFSRKDRLTKTRQ